MSNTINGRTPEEIKKGLECCMGIDCPSDCPYINCDEDCNVVLNNDAIACIKYFKDQLCEATKKIEQLERERDAAIRDIQHVCTRCIHEEHRFLADGKLDDRCGTCVYNGMCNWQWRGVQEVEG